MGELSHLADQHPGDEQLVGQLLLAYYGVGRYGDALRLHQRVQQALRAEGARPGTALTRIYEGILARRPLEQLVYESVREGGTVPAAGVRPREAGTSPARRTADGRAPSGGAADPAPGKGKGERSPRDGAEHADFPGPRTLPRQSTLVGRREELRQLREAVNRAVDQGSPAALETISGMPGTGKTILAVHAAALFTHHFPDGQLYIDLRGHSGGQDPLSPAVALGLLLRQLGTPPKEIPTDVDAASAMWRAMLTARRCVVVLDDAADAAQLVPLLPGDSASLVIATSRRHLVGLPDAHALSLDALPPKDAMALFRRLAGEERIKNIREVARILRLCGYLPLAVDLAAARLRGRPTWPLAALSKRLARSGRLSELYDGQRAIARAFENSYRTLAPAARRAFRLLGLHPGPGFSAEAAAAMLVTSLPQTERQLSHLLDSHLLQETSPNRHKFHDLLADYSIMLMQDEGNEGEGTRVMERLMDFYLFAADIADHVVHPHRLSPAAPHESPAVSLPFERTAADAWAWFEMEREAMLAVGRHARARGNPGLAAVLGQYLAAFLEAGCHWDEAMEFAACSVEHWRRVEHPAALCRSLLSLSAAHAQIGEYPAAESAAEEALALARSLRDQNVVAEALKALGVLRWYSGQNSEALSLFEASSAIREEAGDRWELARLDNNLALTLVHMGRKQEAQEHLQRAIAGSVRPMICGTWERPSRTRGTCTSRTGRWISPGSRSVRPCRSSIHSAVLTRSVR